MPSILHRQLQHGKPFVYGPSANDANLTGYETSLKEGKGRGGSCPESVIAPKTLSIQWVPASVVGDVLWFVRPPGKSRRTAATGPQGQTSMYRTLDINPLTNAQSSTLPPIDWTTI